MITRITACIVFIFTFNTLKSQNWWEQGLVAYYSFDSLSGLDSSLSGNDLSLSSQLSTIVNRKNQSNKAVNFPQAADFAQGLSNHLPSGTNDRSFSVWLRLDQLPGSILPFECPFFYGSQQEGNGQGIVINSVGNISYAGYKSSPSSNADLESIKLINTGEWLHIGCTFDGDTAKIYLNGILDNAGIRTWNTTANRTLHFGRMGTSGGGQQGGGNIVLPFGGAVDDFRAYNRELGAEEILKLSQDDFSPLSSSVGNTEIDIPEISIFPNPVGNILHVSGINNASRLQVMSFSGELISQANGIDQIDISNLKSGTYLIQIQNGEEVIYQSFIKL